MPLLPAWEAALAFVISLVVAGGLALISFRRARWSGGGYVLAAFALVPGVQLGAVALLSLLTRFAGKAEDAPVPGMVVAHVIQGCLPASRSSCWPC
jgi:hypothetical protein